MLGINVSLATKIDGGNLRARLINAQGGSFLLMSFPSLEALSRALTRAIDERRVFGLIARWNARFGLFLSKNPDSQVSRGGGYFWRRPLEIFKRDSARMFPRGNILIISAALAANSCCLKYDARFIVTEADKRASTYLPSFYLETAR